MVITRIAHRLTDTIIRRGAGRESDREVYVYGLDLLISTGINLVCALALALILDRLLITIVFLFFFLSLRSFAGGYHADTHLGCLLVMLAAQGSSLLFIYAVPITFYLWIAVALMILSASLIFILAPVEHSNRPLSKVERIKFKKFSRLAIIIESGVIIGGFAFLPHLADLCMAATLGMLTSALSLGVAVIKNKGWCS